MRRFTTAALTVALLCATAQAQPPRGQGGRMGGGVSDTALLADKTVQEELKLTDDQMDKVKKFGEEASKKAQEMFGKLRDLPREEQREKMQAMMKENAEASKKALGEILKPEQTKRLGEIKLQVRGTQAFADEEVQKTLKITDEQKEKLKSLSEETAKDLRELSGGRGTGRPGAGGAPSKETLEKIEALRKESKEKAFAVLTADQKKQWAEMTGKPVEVKLPAFGGGFGARPSTRPRVDD